MIAVEAEHLLVGEVAQRVHAESWRLSKLAQAGKIPCIKLGRYRAYRREDLPTIKAVAEASGICFGAPVQN